MPPENVDVAEDVLDSEAVTTRFVDVAFVIVSFTAMIVVEVSASIVANAVLITLAMVPLIDEAAIDPPVMVGLVMVVFVSVSIFCERPSRPGRKTPP